MVRQRQDYCVVAGLLGTPLTLAGRVPARPDPAWDDIIKSLKRRKRNFLTGVLEVGEIQAFGRKLKIFSYKFAEKFFFNKNVPSGIIPGFGNGTILLTSWITLKY